MSQHEDPFSIRLKLVLPIALAPIVLAGSFIAVNSSKLLAQTLLAQTSTEAPSFALPQSLPSDTTINVDGSNSMTVINEALKTRFAERFPGTTVTLDDKGTDQALESLIRGDIDLAAVGRPLTDAEKAQGLTEVPISREKIAIIVSADNTYQGDLTAQQFVKIFRGEITDWSEVGGTPGAIRFIDRPDSSDTRQALSQYSIFQGAPFGTGANATKIADDDTAKVVQELGQDGISYAIASQVLNQPNVRVLAMHGTLPDDSRYPYSQPRGYVYKGEPNPAVQAFLGFATSAPGQEVVQTAKEQEAATVQKAVPSSPAAVTSPGVTLSPDVALSPGVAQSPGVAVSPDVALSPGVAQSPDVITAPDAGVSGDAIVPPAAAAPVGEPADLSRLWWLLLPLLGLPLLLWWVKGRGGPAAVVPVAARTSRSRIILTPRNCRDAYAYWEVADADLEDARRQGGGDLKLRLYDVTDIADMDRQTPHSIKEFDCSELDTDRHLPIARDDRDYIAELGYLTNDDRWFPVARSEHVRVPACEPIGGNGIRTAAMLAGGATLATAAAATAHSRTSLQSVPAPEPSRIILTPRTSEQAYAYWEVPEARKAELRQQGGKQLALRVHDVTNLNPDSQAVHGTQQYTCSEIDQDQHIAIPASDRDYVAELGYLTDDQRWLQLARSVPTRVPSGLTVPQPTEPHIGVNPVQRIVTEAKQTVADGVDTVTDNVGKTLGTALAGGAAVAAGLGQAARSAVDKSAVDKHTVVVEGDRTVKISGQPNEVEDCRIILVSRNSQDAYAYWEVAESYRNLLQEQGGKHLTLRIHDATNLDIDVETPHSTQEYECDEMQQDLHVVVPTSDRDYIAELGYYTDDRRWLRLIRSFHVHVPG